MKVKRKKTNTIVFNNYNIIIVFLLFILLIIHLAIISLSTNIDGVNIKKFAASRLSQEEKIPAERGTIYDRNGDIIAQNVSSYDILCYLNPSRSKNVATPRHVENKEETAAKLSEVLNAPKDKILNYLNKDVYQTELGIYGRNLSELEKDKVKALNLPGIEFITKEKRYYPFGSFASYTVGYAKENDGKIKGEMGIEKYFNDKLSGTDGYRMYQKDRKGNKIPNTKEIYKKPLKGKDIYLTIDSNIQLFVEKAMYKEKTRSGAGWRWMSMIVADAKTGEVLAMSQYPTFDPNKRDITNYLDYNVSYSFEPGSTMKTYTFLTAMKKGIYDPNGKFKSGNFVAKDGTVINDWKKEGWGNITYDQGYMQSANTSIASLIKKGISARSLKESFMDFGFGSKTGIKLANETSGKLNFKYETEIVNAGFGQGILTSPIQHIQALTTLSNNGYLLKPYIIKEIYDVDENTSSFKGKKEVLRKVVDRDDVLKIRELMHKSVYSEPWEAVGINFQMPEYGLIGKTGTAQIANPRGGYYKNLYTKSFEGMFPEKDPEILIYIASEGYGASDRHIVNVTKEVVSNISSYMNYQEKDNTNKKINIPSLYNKNINYVNDYFKDKGVNLITIGEGDTVIDYYPNNYFYENSKANIIIKTNKLNKNIPNIKGLSLKECDYVLNSLGYKAVYEGRGFVESFTINGNEVVVKLKSKI